jgi:hypothetical protein
MMRAGVKIGLANLAYNFTRLASLNGRAAPARLYGLCKAAAAIDLS